MKPHKCHYKPITLEILKDFTSGFPPQANVKNLRLVEENGKNIFGIFDAMVTDKLILSRPPIIHYVPSGRALDKNSSTETACVGILARVETKKVTLCKFLAEGNRFAKPLLTIESKNTEAEFENGSNVLFLYEIEDASPLQICKEVREGGRPMLGSLNQEIMLLLWIISIRHKIRKGCFIRNNPFIY